MAGSWLTLRRLAIALPVVFILHVFEEAPTFVAWFNAHVEPDINERLFRSVNATGLVITLVVAAIAAAAPRERAAAMIMVAWTGFLMLANGVFHVVAAIVDGSYVPGLVTALVLYLPMSLLVIAAASREQLMSMSVVTSVALAGGIPMYVHGWRIVFEGGRLL